MKEVSMSYLFDKSGEEYSKNLYAGNSKVKQEEWRLIHSYLKKNQKILDLCCGPGTNLIPLIQQGYSVQGIDFSEGLLKDAKKYAKSFGVKIKVSLGDATALNVTDKTFDAVLVLGDSIGLIQGKEKRQQAINECFRILKNPGIFILSIGNRNSSLKETLKSYFLFLKNFLSGRYFLGLGDCLFSINGNPGFHHSYSAQEAINSLKKAGFKINELSKPGRKLVICASK